jgi:hypothetical protein
MTTTISDLNNSGVLDGLLKNVYLNTMQEVAYNDFSFSSMIKDRSDLIGGGGNNITHFATLQWAQGVGAFGEGENFVNNVPVKGKQLTENVKFLNSYIALTGPVVEAANDGRKSAVNIVNKSFETNILAFKNDFDRQLMGDGAGRMALVSAIDTGTSKMTVTRTNFAGAAYFADLFMPVGTRFHVATFDASGIDSSGPANSNSDDDFGFIVSNIDSVDLSAGTSVLSITDEDGNAYSGAGSHDVAVGDYCYREKTYYATAAAQAYLFSVSREINGLSNLVSDGVANSETTSNFTTNWGLTRTSFSNLQSLMKDFASAQLGEQNLLEIMLDLKFHRQGRANLLMVTPKMELFYFLNQKDNRRFNNIGPLNFMGGVTRTGIQLSEWQLILTSLGAVPQGTLFMINTDDFAFAQNSPMTWILGDGQNALIQSHTGDNKFATMKQYVNFVCFDPRRQAKGFSVAES